MKTAKATGRTAQGRFRTSRDSASNLGVARDRAATVLNELRSGKITTEMAVEKLKNESRRGRTWVDLVLDF